MKNWKIPYKLIVEENSVIFRIREFQKYFESGNGTGPRLWNPNIILLEQIEFIE
jgi:hypothetical protein